MYARSWGSEFGSDLEVLLPQATRACMHYKASLEMLGGGGGGVHGAFTFLAA